MKAPEGYTFVHLPLNGSNVRTVALLVCNRCGAYVGGHYIHNRFHRDLIKEKQSDGSTGETDNSGN